MRVSGSGGASMAQAYADFEDASIGNPMAHVARVLMQAKDQTETGEDDAFDEARTRVEKATAEEVSSMHEAADEVFKGALTGAAFTVAGAALQMASVHYSSADPKLNSSAGSLLKGKEFEIGAKLMTSGAPIASQVFQSRAEDRRADAAQHRGEGAAAQLDVSRHDEQRKRAISDRDAARSTLRTAASELQESKMAQTRIIQG